MFKQSNHQTGSGTRSAARNGRGPGRRWHRRLGLVAAIPVLVLAITGIALNHEEQLGSMDGYVQSDWLLDWYDIGAPTEVVGSEVADIEVLSAEGIILLDGEPALFDQAPLLGVVLHEGLLHVITQTELHLFTAERQRVESLKLPQRVASISTTAQAGIVQFAPGQSFYNLDMLSAVPHMIAPAITGNLTAQLQNREDSAAAFRRLILPRSRVLQDVHSGRFFGKAGVLLMDLFALLFIVLAITGLRMWWRKSRRAT